MEAGGSEAKGYLLIQSKSEGQPGLHETHPSLRKRGGVSLADKALTVSLTDMNYFTEKFFPPIHCRT